MWKDAFFTSASLKPRAVGHLVLFNRQVTASLYPRFQISSRTVFSKTMKFEFWNTPFDWTRLFPHACFLFCPFAKIKSIRDFFS